MITQGLRRSRFLLVALFAVLLLPGRAGAGPLNLTAGTPDISAFFLNFSFNSSGGLCGGSYTLCYSAAGGGISSYGLDPEITDFPVPYVLGAAIDPTTGLLTGGGTFSMGSYLTGTVTDFGYKIAGGAAVLEFLVSVDPSSALYSEFGPTIGVTGSVFDWGTATFGSDPFTVGSADAYTDNFAISSVPDLAGSLLLFGAGLSALAVARRRWRG